MTLSRDQVVELIINERRAAGFPPSSAERARMRAFLIELDAAEGKAQALLALRMVAHRRFPRACRANPIQRPASAASRRCAGGSVLDSRRA